jgi:hypothetical protein
MTTTYKTQLLILFFSLSINAFGQYPSDSKPNIFIYIADDQNSWDYEIFGNNQVKTNNFDRVFQMHTLRKRFVPPVDLSCLLDYSQ